MTLAEAIVVAEDLQALHAGRGRYEWGQDGASPPLFASTAYAEAVATLIAHARNTLAPRPGPWA
jgi:hypothetical protein